LLTGDGLCKLAINDFFELLVSDTKEKLESKQPGELNNSLLISHAFTHRMVGSS
jgi:hypothetical protein